MMGFAKNNPNSFKGYSMGWPFVIGLMKFLGVFFTEIVNIYLIAINDDISDVIMNFIAFGVIADIDDIVGSSITEINCEEENEVQVMYDKRQLYENEFNNLKRIFPTMKSGRMMEFGMLSIFTLIYTIIKVFHYCFFFYFGPFLITFLVFT